MASVYLGNLIRLPAIIKIGEIGILIVSITLVQASDYIRSAIFDRSSEWHTIGLLYGIVIGYLVVYLILIVCYLIGETSTQRSVFELLLNGVGFILFFSLSVVMFVIGADTLSKYATQTIVLGVLLLLMSVCQIMDAVFNVRASRAQ